MQSHLTQLPETTLATIFNNKRQKACFQVCRPVVRPSVNTCFTSCDISCNSGHSSDNSKQYCLVDREHGA